MKGKVFALPANDRDTGKILKGFTDWLDEDDAFSVVFATNPVTKEQELIVDFPFEILINSWSGSDLWKLKHKLRILQHV